MCACVCVCVNSIVVLLCSCAVRRCEAMGLLEHEEKVCRFCNVPWLVIFLTHHLRYCGQDCRLCGQKRYIRTCIYMYITIEIVIMWTRNFYVI